MSTDIHALLDVSVQATKEEIKRAFRVFARNHHPDLHPGDRVREERFKQVSAAYRHWQMIEGAVAQIRRLRHDSGFSAWKPGSGRATFRPWNVNLYA